MPISLPNPMFDHLLELSHRDNYDLVKKHHKESQLKFILHTLSGALHNYHLWSDCMAAILEFSREAAQLGPFLHISTSGHHLQKQNVCFYIKPMWDGYMPFLNLNANPYQIV